MAKVFADISPLREHPEFRRLWIGSVVSQFGSQLSTVAIAYEVFHLTNSDLDVGLVSLVQLVPSLFGFVLGGSVADAMDRRKLLLLTNTMMAVVAFVMAEDVSRAHPSLIALYGLAGVLALIQSIGSPAQSALQIAIVGRETIMKATALTSLSRQLSTVVGPGVGGVLIAAFGSKAAFWANAASFIVILVSVLSVTSRAPVGGVTRFGWTSIVEGFAFLRGRQAIQGTFIGDLNATILGMPTALFPAIAIHHYHGGPETLGLLYAAPAAGALLGGVFSAWTSRIRRLGYAICVCIAIWGVFLIVFGLATSIVLGLFCLAVAGAADMVSEILRNTILQTEAPDRLRGRLTSIQTAVVQSGPRLGNTEAGLVAAVSSTQVSVVSGGIGCVVGIAIIAKLMPKFVNYELPDTSLEEKIIIT